MEYFTAFENEQTACTHSNMDESQTEIEQKKPETKDYILHFIYI